MYLYTLFHLNAFSSIKLSEETSNCETHLLSRTYMYKFILTYIWQNSPFAYLFSPNPGEFPLKICVRISFNFSWADCKTQETFKTKYTQNFGVKEGVVVWRYANDEWRINYKWPSNPTLFKMLLTCLGPDNFPSNSFPAKVHVHTNSRYVSFEAGENEFELEWKFVFFHLCGENPVHCDNISN